MPCIRKWMVFGLLFAAPVLLAQTTPSHHHKSKKQLKPLVLPPLPPGPLRQLPMDQLPPAPAKVTYEGGLLAIQAQNCTLWDVLRDVRRLTGASIDMPAGSGINERVIANLGPGSPRDVLSGLLNGTSFNYVMLGSDSDPRAVSSVMLSPKPAGGVEVQTASNVYQNNPVPQPTPIPPNPQFHPGMMTIPPPQPGSVQAQPATEDDAKDDEENADDNADDQAQPGQQDAGAAIQGQQPDPNQPNAGPRTPEQILEMLRRQQPPQPGMTIPPPPQQ